MNKASRVNARKTQCPVCGIWVSSLRKHKARGRCKYQHIRLKDRMFRKMVNDSNTLNFF